MTAPSSLPFLTPGLLRHAGALRAELQRAAAEMTTGLVTDVGAAQQGDFGTLAGIDRALGAIAGHASATSGLALLADSIQSGLGTIDEAAATISGRIMGTASLATDRQLSDLAAAATQALHQTVGILNTSVSGLSLFSGTRSDTAPLPPAGALVDALEAAVAGAVTAEEARAAIHDWFASPTGYAALYAGGPPRTALPIAAGESVGLDVTAEDEGIRATLEGLAILALVDRGLFDADVEMKRGLVLAAGETLLSAAQPRGAAAARIGTAQERVERARSRNEAERTALEISRVALTGADPYEAATRLHDIETRLETFYLLAARLSRLNLAEYLR